MVVRNLTFQCWKNRAFCRLAFEETHKLLWSSNLGFLVPLSWIRYLFLDDEGTPYEDRLHVSGQSTQDFLYQLLSRRVPIRKHDVRLTGRRRGLRSIAFIGRARRAREIIKAPDSLHPIETVTMLDAEGRPCHGYQIRHGVKSLMIVGLDLRTRIRSYPCSKAAQEAAKEYERDFGIPFDWSQFLVEPE